MAFEHLAALVLKARQQREQGNPDFDKSANFGADLGGSIGGIMQQQKQKGLLDQIIQAMNTQGAPQQGPPLAPAGTPQPNLNQIPPGQPMTAGKSNIGQDVQMPQPIPTQTPGQTPASGIGAPPQDNTALLKSLLFKLNPQAATENMTKGMFPAPLDPLKESERIKNLALAKKDANPPNEWYDTGRTTKAGFPIIQNKASGEEKVGTIKAEPKKDSSKEDEKYEKQQDALEKQYADRIQKIVNFRSGGLGLQDQKVNQAIDLRTMVNQYYDPKTKQYIIPPALHSELVLGLARLVSPSGQVGVELEQELKQKTAREGLAKMGIYFGMDPRKLGGPTQNVVKLFVDSIDRQGQKSEQLRDTYMKGIRSMFPTRLDPDRRDRLMGTVISSSFDDLLKQSPDQAGASASGLTPDEIQFMKTYEAKHGIK